MIPTDPIQLAIWLATLAIDAITPVEALQRMQTGISAQAEKEGRDVTPEEEQLLDSLREASKQRRDGK